MSWISELYYFKDLALDSPSGVLVGTVSLSMFIVLVDLRPTYTMQLFMQLPTTRNLLVACNKGSK